VAPLLCLLQSVTEPDIACNRTGGENMKQPAPYELQSYINLAIYEHNKALREQMNAGQIEYENFLKAAFPADSYSVIAAGVERCLEEHNAN
jgi:hypothetical protein